MSRWEETHKHFAKDIYARTPRRTLTLENDMFNTFMYKMKVMAIAREVGSRLIATNFIKKYTITTSEILLYFIDFQLGLETALDQGRRETAALQLTDEQTWKNFGNKPRTHVINAVLGNSRLRAHVSMFFLKISCKMS